MHTRISPFLKPLISRTLILILFITVSAAANPADDPAGLTTSFAERTVRLDVSRTSPEHTTISLTNPPVVIRELRLGGESFQIPVIEGEAFLPQEGSPAIPQITRFYRIPNTGSVELVVREAEFDLVEDFLPYPYHEPGKAVQNSEVYRTDSWYPSEIAKISAPMIFRDMRVVTVTLYPVQVNPVTRQARVYGNIDVEIVADNQSSVNELRQPRRPSGRFAPMYRHLIRNFDEHALDDATTLPGTYLILADDHTSMHPWVDSLTYVKKRRGFDVVVEMRPNWTRNQMRDFIQGLYATSEPPLEFVALMGDPNAPFGVPTGTTGWDSEYDHVFALGNAGDDIEDIGVGRLSGASSAEMATIDAKIKTYEYAPWLEDDSWAKRAFLYVGINYDLASNWLLAQWADQQFRMHTGLDSNIVAWYNGQVREDFIRSVFADGISLFLWRGTWIGNMQISLPPSLGPSRILPICFLLECGTGNYDWGLSLSEAFLVAGTPANLKGGVCGIGQATAGGSAAYNITLTGGFVYSIANMGIEHLGHALNAAKAWLYATYGAEHEGAKRHCAWTNLMGDPGLSMWTDVPVIMDVTHPETLPVGTRQVQLSVGDTSGSPIGEALVVLWKGEETYVKVFTDSSGEAVLPVTIDSPGNLLLTVTKRNHKPYLFDIPCSEAAQLVTVNGFSLDDDNTGGTHGNGDGELNPGETIDLTVTLKNHGTVSTATGITAALTTDNPNVTVISGTSTYPNIPPDEQATGEMPFRIQISSFMPHQETALLTLEVESMESASASAFELTCRSGDIAYVDHLIPMAPLEPGTVRNMLVTIENCGVLDLEDVTASLSSFSNYVTVLTGERNYGDLPAGGQATDPTGFVLQADSLAYRGQQADMRMIIEAFGFRDTVQFTISLGTAETNDPSGPDSYGYYAYDNTDMLYEEHREFGYIDISEGLGVNLDLNDTGEQTNINQIWSVARALPFEFTYYGISYDTITICSNGWAAFGNQGWNSVFRNYPLPGILSASAMLAVYWDDLKTAGEGHGVWEAYDEMNHLYIVQWKAGGGSNFMEAELDFELILFDPAEYPTRDGNGEILFQYQDVTMNLSGSGYHEAYGSTIGIQDHTSLIGLQYAYQVDYIAGAAEVVDSRAILFTTDGPPPVISNTPESDVTPMPETFALHQNYPNPFNASTVISFDLPQASRAQLRIFDITGRVVTTLADEHFTAGTHRLRFDGSKYPSGVYFTQLQGGDHRQIRKLILLK